MKREILFATLLFVMAPVAVGGGEVPLYVHESDGVNVRLMPGACVEPTTLAFVATLPVYAERFRAIESVWRMRNGQAKPFAGCWLELSEQESGGEITFVLVFEDGERYVIPKAAFLQRQGDPRTRGARAVSV